MTTKRRIELFLDAEVLDTDMFRDRYGSVMSAQDKRMLSELENGERERAYIGGHDDDDNSMPLFLITRRELP